MSAEIPPIHTRIWREEAEANNPYATRAAYCRGYNVFGQMVGQARWVEMLALLFRDQLPSTATLDMLEALAVALANPGPRDPSIHAAMCGGVGESTAAATLISALAVGAGRYGGARDVFAAMTAWQACADDFEQWLKHIKETAQAEIDIWPTAEHVAGFDPHGVSTATIVLQLLSALVAIGESSEAAPRLAWLQQHRQQVETAIGIPLDITGVAAAALADIGFSPAEGEMLFLILRLPGAAAHALEQTTYGFKRFPFYPVELSDDPAVATTAPDLQIEKGAA